MSTNGTISIKTEDGKYKTKYSHWDNQIDTNGALLYIFYDYPEIINKLLTNKSYISSLGESIDQTMYGHDSEECSYYDTKEDILGEEYDYLWEDNQWFVRFRKTSKQFEPLVDHLGSIEKVKQNFGIFEIGE